jgi:predicted ATP-grasp superfamily ATP-dependent carboligase
MQSLRRAVRSSQPDIIIPGDDTVVWQLHRAHELYPELRPLIERSLGDPSQYAKVRSRDSLLQIATELGIRTPSNAALNSPAELKTWLGSNQFPAVMKVDGSFSGRGVVVVNSEGESLPVFNRFRQRSSVVSAIGRWIVNRNPLALWSWKHLQSAEVSIQQWIKGRPATALFVSWNGKVVAGVVVEVLATRGATGASTVVRPIADAEITEAGRLIADRLHINGFFGLDFILEEGTKKPYLLELNPRCTQLGHLPVQGQTELAGVLAACIADQPVPEPTRYIPDGPIAFFPQALEESAQLLSASYLDIPVDQPALVRELYHAAWPERQLISRIYNQLRPESA